MKLVGHLTMHQIPYNMLQGNELCAFDQKGLGIVSAIDDGQQHQWEGGGVCSWPPWDPAARDLST